MQLTEREAVSGEGLWVDAIGICEGFIGSWGDTEVGSVLRESYDIKAVSFSLVDDPLVTVDED